MSKRENLISIIQAKSKIADRGITFINEQHSESYISYKDLYDKALCILYNLQAKGISRGEELVFQVEDNRSFVSIFWACILGGIIPVPVSVGYNDEHKLKLLRILGILNKPHLVTTIGLSKMLQGFAAKKDFKASYEVVLIDEIQGEGQHGDICKCKLKDLAFIQFSSGSTGEPKGVMITHENLSANIYDTYTDLKMSQNDSALSWMPLTHDLGLITFHISSTFAGINQYIMHTNVFVMQPLMWIKKADEYKATMLYSPNFGYKHFLNFFNPEIAKEWDLSHVRLILNGAEPISSELCSAFLDRLKDFGMKRNVIAPAYGLAEATVAVSSIVPGEELAYFNLDRGYIGVGQKIRKVDSGDKQGITFVDVGYPASYCQVRICNEKDEVMGDEVVGFIQLKGKSITQGYYNNKEATEKLFSHDGWLNTGDLGFKREERLVITGRAKDIIFVNGQNYYPHDIERVAEELDGVELGKIASCGVLNEKLQKEEIIVFVLFRNKVEEFVPLAVNIKKHLSRQMGLDIKNIIPIKRIPKTTSGKIQRYKLGQMYQDGQFSDVAKQLEGLMDEEFLKNEKEPLLTDTEKKLLEICREVLETSRIGINDNFIDLGITSLLLVKVQERLEKIYTGRISVANFFDYPTISKLAKFIDGSENTYPALVSTRSELKDKDIAIIGIGLKLPQAHNLEEYWEIIKNGVDCVSELPEDRRKDVDDYFTYTGEAEEEQKYLKCAYIDEIDKFDYGFFNLSPLEASLMSPFQRIFLETAWSTVEDAGYGGKKLAGSNTGVFVGFMGDSEGVKYREMIHEVDTSLLPISAIGNVSAILPARISYLMDLKGPSMLVDTACSSSLVAVHMACRALRSGDCGTAIAGGIRLNILPLDIDYLKIGIESSDSATRTFDESSDGSGMGEGSIAVLLKPLSKALEDGDNIYAVIKGSAANQDGSSMGITAPNSAAQEELLVSAWKDADIDPTTLSYIEAHGTGTNLGDPVELNGLQNAFRRYTDKNQFCAIGSVKSNIGHLYESAGLAGLLKAVLALKHRQLPPTIHFNRPNRKIRFEKSPLYVNSRLRQWESGEMSRRCGVSSFGLSGTNCHVVLEEAPLTEDIQAANEVLHILALSAKSSDALSRLVANYAQTLGSRQDMKIEDICCTANTGREHYNYRLAIAFTQMDELLQKLDNLKSISPDKADLPGVWCGKHKIVYDDKEEKEYGDLLEREKLELDRDAAIKLNELQESRLGRSAALEEISRLYIKGADVEWGRIYAQGRRVSLPVYPFERKRCWIDVPRLKKEYKAEPDLHFTVEWIEEKINQAGVLDKNGSIMVFKDSVQGLQLVERLRAEGQDVVEVQIGQEFKKTGDSSYEISDDEGDYHKLIEDTKSRGLSGIIHMMTLDNAEEINDTEELQKSQMLGVYSLFYLTRAVVANYARQIDVVLVSSYVNEVESGEKTVRPHNAPLFGLGKVIGREYSALKVRCIDIDSGVSIDAVIGEVKAVGMSYHASYRNGKRYTSEFSTVNMAQRADSEIEIKQEGVYIITGGTGGIGLEVARYLAAKGKVKLALINRSSMAPRDSWEEILASGKDEKTIIKIKAIKEIEENGSEVICCSGDISDYAAMEALINELRQKYGRICGIVQSAAVIRAGIIIKKDKAVFDEVLRPKVFGTWVLDRLTREDNIDFFAMFSSAVTLIGEAGQGDYIAGNAYQDSYAAYRTNSGHKALAVDWVPWKTAGSSVEFGINIDGAFKAIPTETAIDAFDKALNKELSRVLIGEINYEDECALLLKEMELSQMRLSDELLQGINKRSGGTGIAALKARRRDDVGEVKLAGRSGSEYTEVEKVIAQACREILGFKEISIHDSFFEMGADSILLIKICDKIQRAFPGKLLVADVFQYPTVYKLSRFIAGDGQEDLPKNKKILEEDRSSSKDIAIIGMSAKLPMSNNIEEFWENIRNRINCMEEFPATRRKDADSFLKYKNVPESEMKYLKGAYISEIDKFDYKFFKLAPKEAGLMSPEQRLFLETALEALEDAGYGGKKISGSRTGIYVGYYNFIRDSYAKIIDEIDPGLFSMSVTGNMSAILPSRVSHLLDLRGPSMVIDTACSSSLVSVHLACKAIRNGDCEMAIAGGVKLNTLPVCNESEKIGIESSDGETRTFDNNSDGAGIGEGVAVVLLKPLDRALKDRDNIYAVIKGSAINQDGSSIGLTAPNPAAQTDVITRAWEDSGVDPETIAYIEAHGTATDLGDPIEITGLHNAFKKYTAKKQFCAISSAKSNMGHLYEAAGMAGLLKAVMALRHETIPPTIHFNRPNQKISFKESPVYVNTKPRKWEKMSFPRRCGVSAFGMSGTNSHIILEQAPEITTDERGGFKGPYVFTISAKTKEVLLKLVKEYVKIAGTIKDDTLGDVCYTASIGRGHYEYRLAMIVKDSEDFRQKIKMLDEAGIDDLEDKEVYYAYRKVVLGSRRNGEQGEVTEEEKNELGRSADEKLQTIPTGEKERQVLLENICSLYINGADVEWERLYRGEGRKKVKLPVYPFERSRCWIEIPETKEEVQEENNGLYYAMTWRQEEIKHSTGNSNTGAVMVLTSYAGEGLAHDLILSLGKAGRKVIEVGLGDSFERVDQDKYTISGTEADYQALFGDAGTSQVSQVIHMLALESEIKDLEGLEQSQDKGVYSLFHISRAIAKNRSEGSNTEIFLVSDYVTKITGKEELLKPENATLFGLAKVINKEQSLLNCGCVCIDVDNCISAEDILNELKAENRRYQVAYRSGKRYVEEFGEVDMEHKPDRGISVKAGGVYVITGGTGGIGLEVAKYLTSKAKIKLALINRSKLPERELWEDLIKEDKDKRVCKKIKELISLEASGSEVICYSADVSNLNEMGTVIDEIRSKHGSIHGVVHGAGIGGSGGLIAEKEEQAFDETLRPKIYGTWILDHLTEQDKPEFFVMFSSVATMFCGPGQGDYTAANSYLDSYAEYKAMRGQNAVTVNWTTWKDTGMAADFGLAIDTMFMAMPTEQAICGFDNAINKDAGRVLIGQLNNNPRYIKMLGEMPFYLSDKLEAAVKRSAAQSSNIQSGLKSRQVRSSKAGIELTGKGQEEYTDIEKKVAQIYNEVLGFNEINVNDSFFELGGNSILLIRMHKLLEKQFPGRVAVAELFAYTSVSRLAEHIASRGGEAECAATNLETRDEYASVNTSGDIAVIGMSALLPSAKNIEEYWENIQKGIDCVREVPSDRENDLNDYLCYLNSKASPEDEQKPQYIKSAYLDDIDKFDYKFFRMSPKEASLTDPHQRLLLKTVWHAIEDAGYGGGRIEGTNTSVYIGYSGNVKDSYYKFIYDTNPSLLPTASVGNITSMMPSRISYLLDLKGPTMVVDTACSSSLVGIYTACKALKNGECDMAIAGGVKIYLLPLDSEYYQLGIESSDSMTRTFDNSSDGAGLAEAAGAVILKPLEKALKDKDNIYAVIKGGAINQDGASIGITAPNPKAQEEVIVKAWKDAGIDPETISFMEAHGTGTTLGDPIELEGVQNAFRRYTTKKQFCAIGSIKSNIGHANESAGITGFIKAVQALIHKEIPPTLHFDRPNSKINFYDLPVYVNTKLRKWEQDGTPMRCGVSSFGFSGTNCHLVLEQAPQLEPEKTLQTGSTHVFTLSAKSEEALGKLVTAYKTLVTNKDKNINLTDMCYTANTGRWHYGYRLVFIFRSMEELVDKLENCKFEDSNVGNVYYGVHKIVPQNREFKNTDEITAQDIDRLTRESRIALEELMASGKSDEVLLKEVCRLYTMGANVDWKALYEGEEPSTISLPVYPFDDVRCWIDVPQIQREAIELKEEAQLYPYYALNWRPQELKIEDEPVTRNAVMILRDNTVELGKELAEGLRKAGNRVIEVELGTGCGKTGEDIFVAGYLEEDYLQLFEAVKDVQISDIIHMTALAGSEEINGREELESSQSRGVYSMFHLVRAMVKKGWSEEVKITIVTNYAYEVTGKEERLHPENASLVGFGKVIWQEYSNMSCNCIDIDDAAGADDIMAVLNAKNDVYLSMYRNGQRYVEEMTDIDMEQVPDKKVDIKEDGVYIITGGTGGLGLEIAKYLASKNKVKLALINRSKMPESSEWDELLKSNNDAKMSNRINSIRQMEAAGSEVLCYSADVSNIDEMKYIIDDLREKFGKINGIIHSAGVAGAGYIIRKQDEDFQRVLAPKIYGTWVLDRLTQEDKLDFFALFSSGVTTAGEAGQGDYIAANSYLDAYSAYRNKKGCSTLTVNWVSWKETGMSVDFGINVDSIFKAISTEQAVSLFDRALNKDIQRVLIGELNIGSEFVSILKFLPLEVSPKLGEILERTSVQLTGNVVKNKGHEMAVIDRGRVALLPKSSKNVRSEKSEKDIKLTGKETEGGYTEIERKIAGIYSEVLGFDEINIYDGFYELGGDSIMLNRMHRILEKEFPGKVKLVNLFEHTSISRLSQFIVGSSGAATSDNEEIEEKLDDLLLQMESGSLSIDDAINYLNDI